MSVTATIAYEMQFAGTAGAWSDITDDVVSTLGVQASYGIQDNGPLDRIASTGECTFSLDNSAQNSAGSAGYYSPDGPHVRSGFQTGIPFRTRITYNGETYTKFYGRIVPSGIQVESGQLGTRRTHVTVCDYMEQTAVHDLYLPDFTTSKKINEVVPLIVANMPIAPKSTDYNTGQDTFNTVFDTVRSKTTAMSEMTKLALSELGYIYNKFDATNDECLTVEGRYTRNDATILTQLPVGIAGYEYLLHETGGFVLVGTGEKLILDNVSGSVDADFDNTFTEMQTSNGKYIYNRIKAVAYPRKTDTSATVLATLQKPIQVGGSETVDNLFIRYRDPLGGVQNVSGRDMVTPAGTVDYLLNAAEDGTGTDYTANLTVTADYGTEGVEYTLENAGPAGYVTLLQARGKGIYIYDPVELLDQDTASEAIHGTRSLDLDMKYQDSPLTAASFAAVLKGQYKDPRTIVDKVTFYANRDEKHMVAFLVCEPGSKIHLTEPIAGIDHDYFINGVEYDILPNGVIRYSWYVKPASEDSYTLWYLGVVGYSEIGVTTKLGY